jgi:hypothetical protein
MFFPTSLIQLRDIKGVAAGGLATINCPKGPRYRRIILALQDSGAGNANAPAIATFCGTNDMLAILGTKTVRTHTAGQLDYLNTQNGTQYASYGVAGAGNGGGITYLPIYFEEPWRKRADFQNGLAWETGWMDSNGVFQIKVPIAAGVTTPVLGAVAIVDGFSSGKANPIMKYYAEDVNTAAASVELANIFQGATASDLVETISLFDPSDSVAQSKQVKQVRLILNNQVVLDDVTLDQMTTIQKGADMNPTVGAYNIVFDHDDLFESLRQVSSVSQSQLTATLKAASAGIMRRITQRVGDPTL